MRELFVNMMGWGGGGLQLSFIEIWLFMVEFLVILLLLPNSVRIKPN